MISNEAPLEVALDPDVLRRNETIEVRDRADEPQPVASRTMSALEFQNTSSVLVNDPLRSVQALPGVVSNDDFQAQFSFRGAEFRRIDGELETHTTVSVSTEDNAEVRRVRITNLSETAREIEVTSYAEVVLARPTADAAHPAFGNLFVETEYLPSTGALVAKRRPRSSTEDPVWAVHVSVVKGESVGSIQYETDRSRFLARGRGPSAPAAVGDRPSGGTIELAVGPNPSRGRVTATFALPHATQNADVAIFDATGRRVKTLIHGPLAAGPQTVTWTGHDDAGRATLSGIFFMRIQADEHAAVKKVLMVR